MTRRTLLTRLAMLFIALVAFAASDRASAATPAPPCCDFIIVDIDCSIPPNCFPIQIDTYWSNGMTVTSPMIPGCGPFTIPLVPPLPPCYANPSTFKSLTLLGSTTMVFLNQPTTVKIGDCCYIVYVYIDTTGCLRIKISRC